MRLNEGAKGSRLKVLHMDLPVQTERRLEALGLTPCGHIVVMNKKPRGAMIVKFRGSRFAVGRSMTEKIIVKEASAT